MTLPDAQAHLALKIHLWRIRKEWGRLEAFRHDGLDPSKHKQCVLRNLIKWHTQLYVYMYRFKPRTSQNEDRSKENTYYQHKEETG